MKHVTRRHVRNCVVGLLLVGLAAWVLPSYFSAERYRHRLEAGLERALHRPVTFGSVYLHLIPRPGFTIENAVVRESPDFGSEPFARVDRIECDLRWRSLWRSRLDFSRLRLDHPSLNLVRNDQGAWNFENFLLQSGITSAKRTRSGEPSAAPREGFQIEASDARINFKVGADKKPFALTELRAWMDFDPERGRVQFRLRGRPVRTDLSLPSPGEVELTGDWIPGSDLNGPLRATLQTREALLYNWIPLVTGRNPDLYGVLDLQIQLTGTLHVINIEGETRLAQFHRWEQIPPSDPMPWTIHLRGQFDRVQGRVAVESLEASFADSHIHVSGSVEKIPQSPQLDLVVALERSRLEDLVALGRRFWTDTGSWSARGRVDGLLAIQGPWSDRRFGGFLGVREVALSTSSGTYPISDVAVRIDNRGAHLAPVKVNLAPRVELVAEGDLERRKKLASLYELRLSAKGIPLRNVLAFGRSLGYRRLQGLNAEGVATATFRLAGSAWPFSRPALTGRAEVHAARLLIPGLTEPLNVPRAIIRVNGSQITADPVVAVLGTSVFTGKLTRQGESDPPWVFDVRANSLSLEQGSLWFDVLGRRRPLPILDVLPGLSTFAARRAAASNLFSSLHLRGQFATPNLTYRGLHFKDFRSSAEIRGRVFRLEHASFRIGGGHGQGSGEVDLTSSPARVQGSFSVDSATLQSLASYLPPQLHSATGLITVTGYLEARGLTREELSDSLWGQGAIQLKDLTFGDFDPLSALARQSGLGTLEPARNPSGIRSALLDVQIRNRRATLKETEVDLLGAKLTVSGTYPLGGPAEVNVRGDFRHVRRHWSAHGDENDPVNLVETLRLAGPLEKLSVVPELRVSRTNP